MTESASHWNNWLSGAFAILCPVSAVVVGNSGNELALAAMLWALSAACPIAWIASEIRWSQRRAMIVATAAEPNGEGAHDEGE